MKFLVSLFILGSVAGVAHSAWQADPPFYAQQYAQVGGVRGLFVDPAGDLLALSPSREVFALYEESNGDGTINVIQELIISSVGLALNHGLSFHDGFLYASSANTVYRWPYTPGNRTQVTVGQEAVINGMPSGGHNTRTIVFDEQGRLYVSVGSNANVDGNSDRARIRRFSLNGTLPIAFNTGEVFADGLRNEVGLAWDLNGVLHGVENGADALNRPDIGGDVHNGNPAEEMNRFDQTVGTHYGYPYCFSTHNLTGQPAGTQYAWPTFMGDGTHTDAWCRNALNNHPPLIPMPAHNAPLGVDFFRGQSCGVGDGAFPCNTTGAAVVAFHGSWNSVIPVGYRVGMFPFDSEGQPTGDEINVVYETPVATCYIRNCFRPVNAVFNANGHLFVSDDAGGQIIKVTYGMAAKPIRNYVVRR
jgi:glucose/arabinose dehydrogenase